MCDGNLAALAKHEQQQERAEKAVENFTIECEGHIRLIENSIFSMKQIAQNYEGYELDETIEELVKELL